MVELSFVENSQKILKKEAGKNRCHYSYNLVTLVLKCKFSWSSSSIVFQLFCVVGSAVAILSPLSWELGTVARVLLLPKKGSQPCWERTLHCALQGRPRGATLRKIWVADRRACALGTKKTKRLSRWLRRSRGLRKPSQQLSSSDFFSSVFDSPVTTQ